MSGKISRDGQRPHHSEANIATGVRRMNISSQIASTGDIRSRLRSLYQQEVFADVHFVLNFDQVRTTFPAHKIILAIGSPVFAEMLYSDEATQRPQSLGIKIENMSPEAFGNVLEYLYTDDAHLENAEEALETLIAAKRFKISVLECRCENVLDTLRLNAEDVCSSLHLASTLKIEKFKAKCMKFIQENTREVIRSNDFLNAQLSLLKTISKLPRLTLRSEAELFDSLLRWHNMKYDGRWDGDQARNALQPILGHIRFLTFQSSEFGALIKKCPGFFSESEALNIMCYIANPGGHNDLPSWCNKGENRCTGAVQSVASKKSEGAGRSVSEYQLNETFDKFQDPVKDPFPNGPRSIKISLLPLYSSAPPLKSLTSLLEIKCNGGRHILTAIRCSFQDPGRENTSLDLFVKVRVEPSGFRVAERKSIQNVDSYVFIFKPKIFLNFNGKVSIQIEATNVQNYRFMRFDSEKSFTKSESPFNCSVGSIPKDQELFFISEVYFKNRF